MPRVLKSAPPVDRAESLYYMEDEERDEHGPMEGTGEVVTYWDPGAFTWYGEEIRRMCSAKWIGVAITREGLRLSHAAGAKFRPGARIAVGLNSRFLAVRESADGLPARREDKPGNLALYISSRRLVKLLQDEGWPRGRLDAVWDERSGMLVCRKPVEKDEKGQRDQ